MTVFYIQLGEPRSCSRLAGPTELSALPEAIFADGHQVGISWVLSWRDLVIMGSLAGSDLCDLSQRHQLIDRERFGSGGRVHAGAFQLIVR